MAATDQTLAVPADAPARDPATRLKVPVVIGTRPEAIKLVPLILALRASDDYEPIVVSTGQHHAMVDEIMRLAGITTDATLYAGNHHSRLNERVSAVMGRFEDFVCEVFGEEPDEGEHLREALAGRFPIAVAVHGDTSSAMAAALSAFHMHIPVIHIEAGLRTGGLNLTPFPEELNRQIVTCIAALHMAPTATNLQNLVRENVPVDQIFVTGNTGIDALRWASGLELPFTDPAVSELVASGERIVVVTAHRRENWGGGLAGIAAGVARLAEAHPELRFVVPLHPNPLVRAELGEPLASLSNVVRTEPLGYAEFAHLLGACHLVLTDSGGIQEEAPSLDKPVLVARESTERIEGVVAGTLRLVGTDPDRIVADAEELLGDDAAYRRVAEAANPYGDGHAAERIVGALESIVTGGRAPAPFGSGFTRRAVISAAGIDVAMGPVEALHQHFREQANHPSGADLWPT